MRRYWISKDDVHGDEVCLEGEVLHHIRDVCRMHNGSKFEVIVEGGIAYLVEITAESKHYSTARIIESRTIQLLPEPHIHLVLAIPRFPVFEAIIEKAVELGVKSIQPVYSEFSFIRGASDALEKKNERFHKIVKGATQQSGRGDLMEIHQPKPLSEITQTFNRFEGARGLFAYEGEAVLSARDGLRDIRTPQTRSVWVFVGSEGGFSDREVEKFRETGLRSVTLGQQVLRVETACVALVSIIKYDFDLMR